ncbi:MAG: bifunctional aldolase/short-chain dehydrogenase [Armatimonadota bacterium]
MDNQWSERDAAEFVEHYGKQWGEDLALRTYTSRLLGCDKSLVLHGGGNASVKSSFTNVLGQVLPALYVKASGIDMAAIEPEGHPGLDQNRLLELKSVPQLSDSTMTNELRIRMFDSTALNPSIEALVHAFIPKKFIDHTHAEAILALTNQTGGERIVREALGDDIIVLPYVKAGFKLAKAAQFAFEANPSASAMVLMHHGIITWGDSARESYDRMIAFANKAEDYIAAHLSQPLKPKTVTTLEQAKDRVAKAAPVLRGVLCRHLENDYDRFVLTPLMTREVLDFVDSERGKDLALTPPLTPDYLIRTKALPMWVDSPDYDDPERLREQLSEAVERYSQDYDAYVSRNSGASAESLTRFDSLPRVIMMPGLGALCVGIDAKAAGIARDITEQAISVKTKIAAMGSYEGLSERDLFGMEYYSLQHAKLGSAGKQSLAGRVGFVTGAAGAIGSGICRGLLEQGCHLAVTDLAGPNLDNLVEELSAAYPGHVIGVPMDVTDSDSVNNAIDTMSRTWGGVDIAVVNAGVAHVSPLKDMDLSIFQKLEKINVEGTLLALQQMARHFELQGAGGDIVLVSTKNVFSPGATFGAYSATKAASHQLARIASLELASIGVRVNMVAPDAVFSDGARKSGLWQEVGPGRMKARGLDEKGLEDYYQSRNLLKAKVTAEHVANAVLFFVTRQTPTTGATIPVDGGLPDATPR